MRWGWLGKIDNRPGLNPSLNPTYHFTRCLFRKKPMRLRLAHPALPLARAPLAACALLLGALTGVLLGEMPVQAQRLVRPDLEVGTKDGSVADLQGVLKLLGFYDGGVTGVYSEATSQAVGRFQAAAGLPMTGRVTASTWDKLFPPAGAIAAQGSMPGSAQGSAPGSVAIARPPILSSDPAAPVPPKVAAPKPVVSVPASTPAKKPAPTATPAEDPFPILREGAQGDAVARLQTLLQRRGVFEGGADGDFGPMTLAAVKAAQEKLGLEPDGVVGPATWEALRR
jgi:N-acetylmuramoyl-L-alanine amidase